MKILMVGGGSGGHVFPLIALQKSLAFRNSNLSFIVVSDRLDNSIKKQFLDNTVFLTIQSGKVRRFAHWRWWQYFYPARYKFYVLNIFDIVRLLIGIGQSLSILSKHKPTLVFAKGGFVSVPMGIAASWRSIPLVLHESDTRPGLAGRLLRKRAVAVAQGMKLIEEPNSLAITTGIPVRESFFTLDQEEARRRINISTSKPLLVIACGSLGAKRVNQVVLQNITFLLRHFIVVHITGSTDYENVVSQTKQESRGGAYQVYPFITDDYPETIVAADIIVARAGATTIAELAAAAKPTIFIPNSYLTDQVSNTSWLEQHRAGIILHEDQLLKQPSLLEKTLIPLLDASNREELSKSISMLAKKDAADRLAEVIEQVMSTHNEAQ